jgi:hypothetical protein
VGSTPAAPLKGKQANGRKGSMKLYSDKLTRADLSAACTGEAFFVDEIKEIHGARVRSRGWDLRLGNFESRRHGNSGTHGAATWKTPAASWDDHGRWMARLCEIDPKARIAYYDGRDDFHRATGDKYREAATV